MADEVTPNVPNTSLSALIATLAPTAIIAAVYFSIFLILRRSQRRWYAPRTYLGSMREEERTTPLPNGLLNWIGPFWKIPDTYALQHQSLDAYLFLRFLRMTVVIMFVGCCITWPVLFPVNITGGKGQEQLDMLSMSNIDKESKGGKYKYFAHAGVAWLYFGFVLFLVTRESIFYINLRQAFLLSPMYANRISSRTVLFTSVPEIYLSEAKLRQVFGSAVRRIWIGRDTEIVDELVEKRDEAAYKLEAAEVKLIKLANGERLKAAKNGGASGEEEPISGDAESGSLAGRWIPTKKRPSHKLGKFGLIGKKVDTINWAREELATLIPATEAAQANYLAHETKLSGSVFIEFTRQSDAQAAFQTLSHHQALHMSPRYIGINPNEIVWKSLKISWWQRVIRRFAVLGFITAMIVFWAIPVAFVGLVSNINYLMTEYTWLAWLEKIPSQILGVITGLLPSVALAILMSLVPIVMRVMAKIAGEPSLARVELFTQNAYFVFQVIQVFLVVTLGSSASAVIQDISKDPGSTPAILAEKLPKASNFYINYFVVQGLTIASNVISQVVGFAIFRIMYMFLAGTPRKMYQKWSNLSAISWGSTLPVFTNIAVIGIVYSCIAPLVLGFATIGMSLFYMAFRYNILFVTDSQIDTKGLIYPRALQQLLTGVYIAEICLIGLFGIAATAGPLILMVIFLIFTVLYHFSLNSALDPLLYNLPKSLEAEEEFLRDNMEGGVESHDSAIKEKNGEVTSASAPRKKPNFISKFFAPHIYSDYHTLRKLVSHSVVDPETMYQERVAASAYLPPAVKSETPLLWIPRDPAGISSQEVGHTSRVIPITDDGCTMDEKNKLVWDTEGARPPLWKEKIYY
ncbi:hypothetical protein BJ875DRAFT_450854 [Amylocarpus encephaloides]|uniref:CSC1/OSCA1-like 7TM region domain-containing protein n=1 Tax=Amylocarpus encephaloides TaxID=45428 RepID=A0A9P7YR71_9HELO|nr:hypothetical protein BJ875DRAFT_450854 [Amylocarpus encephaloides]